MYSPAILLTSYKFNGRNRNPPPVATSEDSQLSQPFFTENREKYSANGEGGGEMWNHPPVPGVPGNSCDEAIYEP